MLCRNMKELRELICVSRLDYREEERVSSESDDTYYDSPRLNSEIDGDKKLLLRPDNHTLESPDSGITRSASLCSSCSEVHESGSNKKSASPRQFSSRHKWSSQPRTPIQALQSRPSNHVNLRHSVSFPLPAISRHCSSQDFAHMLDAINVETVSEWLQEANGILSELSVLCKNPNNFVVFGHFWMSKMSGVDRVSLIRLEHGIFVDRLNAAFLSELTVQSSQVRALVEAVFHEYPRRLLSTSGIHLVLSYLDILTLSQHDKEFCRLMSNIHCSTSSRQHTEIVLALRAYAITSILSAVVEFFKKVNSFGVTANDTAGDTPVRLLSVSDIDWHAQQRMTIAVRNGLTDVIHYLIKSGRVRANFIDIHQRSLIFLAVVHRQPKVVQFLLTHAKCRDDVNVNLPSDSGNTPLHTASSFGDVSLVDVLLTSSIISVNAANQQANDATPLHLAIMHGHYDVVTRLLAAGADPQLTTGGLNAFDVARDFGHSELLDLLDNCEDVK